MAVSQSKYVRFFLNSNSNIVQLECVEFIHPHFSVTHKVVRNKTDGVIVKHEDATVHQYDYYPLKISHSSASDDLDYSFKIEFGDLGEKLPKELDRIAENDGFAIKPIIKLRLYRSDDLDNIMYGPIILEAQEFTFSKLGAAFDAKAPSLNVARTGEIYTLDRFPMLRGFL